MVDGRKKSGEPTRLTADGWVLHVEPDATPEATQEIGGGGMSTEPAECELEAIAALLESAERHRAATWAGPSFANVARWLFDRGVRVQEVGAALPAEHAPPDTLESLSDWLASIGWWDLKTEALAKEILGRFGRTSLAGRGPDYKALAIEFNQRPLTYSDGIQLSPATAVCKFAEWLGGRNEA